MAVSRIVVFTAVIAVMLPMAAIISNAPSADAAAAKAFNFTEFLGGHWTVEIRTVTPGSPKSVADDSDELGADNEVTLGNYILHKKPPSFLEGVYYENITNSPSDIKNALRVRVDCSSGSAGVFKTARAETDIFEESLEDEPELQFRTLFEFDFQAHKNGMQVSSGEWHGRKKGIYQFAVASPSTFVLSVYPKGPTEKDEPFTMQTMTGQKEVIKSFWETYGFQLVLIGMIIVPRLFLSAGGGDPSRRRSLRCRLPEHRQQRARRRRTSLILPPHPPLALSPLRLVLCAPSVSSSSSSSSSRAGRRAPLCREVCACARVGSCRAGGGGGGGGGA